MNNQRDFVVNVTSAIVRNVLIASENETVSFVIVNFVSVTFVIVSFVRTRAPHSSSTSLTLCENVNTPLSFFCRISLSESVMDYETETVSFCDGAFPSSSFAYLKKAIQISTYRDHQFLIVFPLWSDIFLLSGKVNVNAIDDCVFLFVLQLNVSDLARSVIQHGRSKIAIDFHQVSFSYL